MREEIIRALMGRPVPVAGLPASVFVRRITLRQFAEAVEAGRDGDDTGSMEVVVLHAACDETGASLFGSIEEARALPADVMTAIGNAALAANGMGGGEVADTDGGKAPAGRMHSGDSCSSFPGPLGSG